MKKLLLLLALIIGISGYSQNYKIGVGLTNTLVFKTDGKLTVSEKKVIFEINNKGKITTNEYDVVKKVNNIIYITDGVMTHYLNFIDEKGKKKGFEYDNMIAFNMDKRQGDVQLIYYCKLEQ